MDPAYKPKKKVFVPYSPRNYDDPKPESLNEDSMLSPIQYSGSKEQAKSAGYQPPAQYGDMQAEANNNNDEKQAINAKIAENEKAFQGGFPKFYRFWLMFLICASIAGFTYAFTNIVAAASTSDPFPQATNCMIFLFVNLIWQVLPGLIGLPAIYHKSVTDTNTLVKITVSCCLPIITLDVLLINSLAEYIYPNPKNDWTLRLKFYIAAVSTYLVVHIGTTVRGAFKVRKLIFERALLQDSLNEIDAPFRI